MDWDKIAVAGAGVLAVALQLLRDRAGRSSTRSHVKHDLEILALLPESSAAKARLEASIDERVGRMLEDEAEKRRDPYSTLLGIIFLVLAVWMTTIGTRFWSLWLVPAAILLLFGLVGLFQGLVPQKRDEKGRIISKRPNSSESPSL